jgi:molecular chaperone Hsp33
MEPKSDHVMRAVTEDGAFRVVAVHTTSTARGAAQAQGAKGDVARNFAKLVTATILVRELMSPDFRVQGILTGSDGVSRLVADSQPDGSARGLVQLARGAQSFSLGEHARLQMMRSLRNGALQQGVVEVPEGTGVGGAIMEYLQTSEQLVSTAAIGALLDDAGDVRAAGGWVVQLLPEASRGPLTVMTNRLEAIAHIEHLLERDDADPAVLLRDILAGMPFERTAESTLRFGCNCSEERIMAGLATISRDDLQSMIDAGEVLDIACDYCGRKYAIPPEKLRGLITEN